MLLGRQLFQFQNLKQIFKINFCYQPIGFFSSSVLKYLSTNTFILINYSLNYLPI